MNQYLTECRFYEVEIGQKLQHDNEIFTKVREVAQTGCIRSYNILNERTGRYEFKHDEAVVAAYQ